MILTNPMFIERLSTRHGFLKSTAGRKGTVTAALIGQFLDDLTKEFHSEPGLANEIKDILGMELKIPELIGDKQSASEFLEAVNE